MILYRNRFNLQYYRAIDGKVSTSKDTIVWLPSVFTEIDLLDNSAVFEIVKAPAYYIGE